MECYANEKTQLSCCTYIIHVCMYLYALVSGRKKLTSYRVWNKGSEKAQIGNTLVESKFFSEANFRK